MRLVDLSRVVVEDERERCDVLQQIALDAAAAAGVLREREQRLAAAARFRIGTEAADHMKTDLVDAVLDELGRLPGTDADELHVTVVDTIARCAALRGTDYLGRCVSLLTDAAASVLTLARSLAPEEAWRRQELLGIASHLAWCAHKDGEQCAALHPESAAR
jgi:hypothetical protein